MTPLDATDFDKLLGYVGTLDDWPVDCAEAVVSCQLPHDQLCVLTLFLLGNGVPPTVLIDWFVRRNMLRDVWASGHVVGLLHAHKSGRLEAAGEETWVVKARGKRIISTPSFDEKQAHCWERAIAKLCNPDGALPYYQDHITGAFISRPVLLLNEVSCANQVTRSVQIFPSCRELASSTAIDERAMLAETASNAQPVPAATPCASPLR